jgi:xylan 1,4-beta-xylosidase
MIRNPILPGFNPDPAVCRVADDIYIATSTFEWWPGVQIHHSRDLVHWRLAARPLTRRSQLDLVGVPDSGGIWAPCLTHAHGRFWLVYTNVHQKQGAFKDTPNYVVTAERIEGPWSDPIPLNRTGFDPSLFHDDDGRSWLTTMRWNHQPRRNRFDGIVLQEFDRAESRLVGPVFDIFEGSPLGGCEGPHLYRREGWYFLVVAEGGTGYDHAITVARSRSITGPYEIHPDNPLLTSRGDPSNPLQKSGHGGLVQLGDGSWWVTHLCARPLPGTAEPGRPGTGRCLLGRETAIQPLKWDSDGWPRLAQGGRFPAITSPAPALPPHPWPDEPSRFDFEDGNLPHSFQSPRRPVTPDWCDLASRPGWLRLYGGESPMSRFHQSCLARRIATWESSVTACFDAAPRHHQHLAALMAIYDTEMWFSLGITWDRSLPGGGGRVLRLSWCDNGIYDQDDEGQARLVPGPVELRLVVEETLLTCWWRQGEGAWNRIGGDLDASKLSDEYGWSSSMNFTGSWFGVQVMDAAGDGWFADIDRIEFGPGTLP